MINKSLIFIAFSGLVLTSCIKGDATDPGIEYAPQMYVSIPYEPYSQVKANSNNPTGMNMRLPVDGSIARQPGIDGNVPIELLREYPIGKDSIDYAASLLKNPVALNDANLAQGKYLYDAYCLHCHGEDGKGNGPVNEKYGGVANFNASYVQNKKSGHIYHTITMGKGRMWPHGSQILPIDRWKIVHYVNKLRNYSEVNGQ